MVKDYRIKKTVHRSEQKQIVFYRRLVGGGEAQTDDRLLVKTAYCKRSAISQGYLVHGVDRLLASLFGKKLFEHFASRWKVHQPVIHEETRARVLLYLSIRQIHRIHSGHKKSVKFMCLQHFHFLPQLCYVVKFLLPFEDIYKKILANNIVPLVNIIVK